VEKLNEQTKKNLYIAGGICLIVALASLAWFLFRDTYQLTDQQLQESQRQITNIANAINDAQSSNCSSTATLADSQSIIVECESNPSRNTSKHRKKHSQPLEHSVIFGKGLQYCLWGMQ